MVLDPESLPQGGEVWDWVFIAALGSLFLFLPAAFGAVEAWSKLIALIIAAGLSFCLVARIAFDGHFRVARTWLYLPLGCLLFLTVLQMVPLPAGLVRAIAPANLALKEQMLDQTFEPGQLVTVSLYPWATADYLRLALLGTIVFITVASICRRSWQVKTLLTVVFAIGCAEAAIALAQIATGTGSIYWSIPVKAEHTTAGTFINYSNFSQFMNLSIGAGLALLLVRVEEQRRHDVIIGGWGSVARGYWEKNAWIFAGLTLCALSVFASMSRNGAISMIVAAAVVGAALVQRRSLSWRGWLVGGVPAAVLAVLLIFGFDVVYARLATLQESDAFSMRWEMTAAAFRAWQQFPIFGTGLGTHEFVYPLFEQSVTTSVAGHADNDYAQLLEETGLVGVLCVVAIAIGVAVLGWRLARHGRKSTSVAIYGLLFGIVAVAIHSASDFGQRVPANLALTAAFCGLAVALARQDDHAKTHRAKSHHAPSPILRYATSAVAGVLLIGLWSFAVRDAYRAYLGERWWSAATAIDDYIRLDPGRASDQDYIDLIAAAQNAVESDSGNVSYGYWLNYFRWESMARVDDEAGRTTLHPEMVPVVARLADDLAILRPLCPTYGPPYTLEGQLRLFVLNDAAGGELIRTGARLAPYDAPSCLVAGELAAREGRLEDAQVLLARAVQLQPAYFREVAELYLTELKRTELARALAGSDHNRLHELANVMSSLPEYADEVKNLRAEAEAILRARVNENAADSNELASLARLEGERGDSSAAITLYRQALSGEYQQLEWRLELANLLAKTGELDEAIHEVRIALRLRPRHSGALKLLEELTTKAENARSGRLPPDG